MPGKIKNFWQLRLEKKQLKQRQKDLELVIRKDYNAVKKSVQPGNLIREAVRQRTNRILFGGVLKSALSYLSVLFKKEQQ